MTMTFNMMFRSRKRQRCPLMAAVSEEENKENNNHHRSIQSKTKVRQVTTPTVSVQSPLLEELERLRAENQNLRNDRLFLIRENESLLKENDNLKREKEYFRQELQEERERNADLLTTLLDANTSTKEIGPVQHGIIDRIEWDGRGRVGDYQLEELLGEGAFAQVWRGYKHHEKVNSTSRPHRRKRAHWEQHLAVGDGNHRQEEEVAIKVFHKSSTEVRLVDVNTEIEVLRHYPHHNIVGFHTAFQTTNSIYVIMEKAETSLYDVLKGRGDGDGTIMTTSAQPDLAQQVVLGILRALAHLHTQGVAHGDLSCRNILIASSVGGRQQQHDDDNRVNHNRIITADMIRLCDFGCSSTPNNPNSQSLGTPGFSAPEMAITENFDVMTADMWSLGAILILCRYGYDAPIVKRWRQVYDDLEDYADPKAFLDGIRQCVKELGRVEATDEGDILLQSFLCHDLLQMDPKRRESSSRALRHPWFNHIYPAV